MRFTLAACLALTAFLAMICFLMTTKPSIVAYFLLVAITILAPVCAVAGIVYGRDNLRAFCIGAALPLGLLVWSSSQELREISLEPTAYGWSSQAQQQTDSNQLGYTTLKLMSDNNADNNAAVSNGNSTSWALASRLVRLRTAVVLNQPPVHARTLERAQAMTSPTCTLSIAALVCGVLVMAIRGGLKPKESNSGQPTSGILG